MKGHSARRVQCGPGPAVWQPTLRPFIQGRCAVRFPVQCACVVRRGDPMFPPRDVSFSSTCTSRIASLTVALCVRQQKDSRVRWGPRLRESDPRLDQCLKQQHCFLKTFWLISKNQGQRTSTLPRGSCPCPPVPGGVSFHLAPHPKPSATQSSKCSSVGAYCVACQGLDEQAQSYRIPKLLGTVEGDVSTNWNEFLELMWETCDGTNTPTAACVFVLSFSTKRF